MIIGIGTDIVAIKRIQGSIENYGERFLKKIFTETEQAYCNAREKTAVLHYAGRFAVKEAFSKAIGTGIRQGFVWNTVGVVNEPSGKPEISLTGVLQERWGQYKIHVSISHTEEYAMAMVIIEDVQGENR